MLNASLRDWLEHHADALHAGRTGAADVLPRLADAGVFRVGVPTALGGDEGTCADAVQAIAEVAAHSLTAAFVFWGQRAFIEYLLHTPNIELRERLLPRLLSGELAGATGLSNAMKFLSGIEELQVRARGDGAGYRLDGRLPWVTNLRTQGFVVACAVDHGSHASVFALPNDVVGLTRSPDLDLIGLRSSDTAALALQDVQLGAEWLLHEDGPTFLRAVRPGFLALQCGLALGLARRSLDGAARADRVEQLEREHAAIARELRQGLEQQTFARTPATLFELKIRLVELALEAVGLELAMRGGKAYLSESFARRWTEAAFLPIVTPSCVQLRAELDRQRARVRAT